MSYVYKVLSTNINFPFLEGREDTESNMKLSLISELMGYLWTVARWINCYIRYVYMVCYVCMNSGKEGTAK